MGRRGEKVGLVGGSDHAVSKEVNVVVDDENSEKEVGERKDTAGQGEVAMTAPSVGYAERMKGVKTGGLRGKGRFVIPVTSVTMEPVQQYPFLLLQ